MTIALIVTASVLAYLFIGGFVGRRFYDGRFDRCAKCRRREEWPYDCHNNHGIAAFFIGASWPFALPMMAGDLFSRRADVRADRNERRHQQRMKELEAQASLAREQKEKTLADIQFLVENGIEANVPGLYER